MIYSMIIICQFSLYPTLAQHQSLFIYPISYSYILKVPFNADGASGIVYVWIGDRSDPEDGKLAEEIANWLYDVSYSIDFCNNPVNAMLANLTHI